MDWSIPSTSKRHHQPRSSSVLDAQQVRCAVGRPDRPQPRRARSWPTHPRTCPWWRHALALVLEQADQLQHGNDETRRRPEPRPTGDDPVKAANDALIRRSVHDVVGRPGRPGLHQGAAGERHPRHQGQHPDKASSMTWSAAGQITRTGRGAYQIPPPDPHPPESDPGEDQPMTTTSYLRRRPPGHAPGRRDLHHHHPRRVLFTPSTSRRSTWIVMPGGNPDVTANPRPRRRAADALADGPQCPRRHRQRRDPDPRRAGAIRHDRSRCPLQRRVDRRLRRP